MAKNEKDVCFGQNRTSPSFCLPKKNVYVSWLQTTRAQSIESFVTSPSTFCVPKIPVHYEVTIKPDLVKLAFEGTQSVTLKVCLIQRLK
jgi:hypothetical protein